MEEGACRGRRSGRERRREVSVQLVADAAELARAATRLAGAGRLAVDVESNGLFKYKATLCTIQIASADEVIVVDPLATKLDALRDLLGAAGPRKIVHDVSFDARILADVGIALGNVLDTSIAARMLGRQATGLASLMKELGIELDKKLQHHDWTLRPIGPVELQYLSDDVVHLEALAQRLEAELEATGIGDAVEEETRYRLAQAIASSGIVDPRPTWVRLKGVDRAPREDWPILRRLAEIREARARALDVPPYKVIGPDVLFAIARARPTTFAELDRIKGATSGSRARGIASAMVEAVHAEPVPEAELAFFDKPRPPAAEIKARRGRETRLTSWRKAEAKARGIDEQVVLPGHCLQDLADLEDLSPAGVAAIPGLGAFRAKRDAEAILRAITEPGPGSEPESPKVTQP